MLKNLSLYRTTSFKTLTQIGTLEYSTGTYLEMGEFASGFMWYQLKSRVGFFQNSLFYFLASWELCKLDTVSSGSTEKETFKNYVVCWTNIFLEVLMWVRSYYLSCIRKQLTPCSESMKFTWEDYETTCEKWAPKNFFLKHWCTTLVLTFILLPPSLYSWKIKIRYLKWIILLQSLEIQSRVLPWYRISRCVSLQY